MVEVILEMRWVPGVLCFVCCVSPTGNGVTCLSVLFDGWLGSDFFVPHWGAESRVPGAALCKWGFGMCGECE